MEIFFPTRCIYSSAISSQLKISWKLCSCVSDKECLEVPRWFVRPGRKHRWVSSSTGLRMKKIIICSTCSSDLHKSSNIKHCGTFRVLFVWIVQQASPPCGKSSRRPGSTQSSGPCSASGSSTTTLAPLACPTCTSSAASARSLMTSTSARRSAYAASGWSWPSLPAPTTPRPSRRGWPGCSSAAWSEVSTTSTWPWRSCRPSTRGCSTSCTTGSSRLMQKPAGRRRQCRCPLGDWFKLHRLQKCG